METYIGWLDMCEQLMDIAQEVAEEQSVEISPETIRDVMYLCWRKMEVIKKPVSYLPILFRCELKMRLQARYINMLSGLIMSAKEVAENVRCMQNVPLSPQMSQCS